MNSQLSSLNKALIGRLGVHYATVLVSLYGNGGTDREKAKVLGLSCSTLVRLRRRARNAVLVHLNERMGEPEHERSGSLALAG